MAKRTKTSTFEQLALAFELYKRIPQNKQITAKELQAQLAEIGLVRDIRSIQRNLDVILKYFDIEKDDRDKPYGYRKRNRNQLNIGPQEALLLSIAESYLRNLLPITFIHAIGDAFQSARYQLLPDLNNKKEVQWLKKVKFISETQPLIPPPLNTDVFDKVSIALYYKRFLTVYYRNEKQEDKAEQVMPLGLAQQGNRLYLVCRFEQYNTEKTLALHRIEKAVLSTFTFEHPTDFDLGQCELPGQLGEGQRITLSFTIDKEVGQHLKETPLSLDQIIIELEQHYEVTASTVDSMLLDRWLNGFGDNVSHIQKIPMNTHSLEPTLQ